MEAAHSEARFFFKQTLSIPGSEVMDEKHMTHLLLKAITLLTWRLGLQPPAEPSMLMFLEEGGIAKANTVVPLIFPAAGQPGQPGTGLADRHWGGTPQLLSTPCPCSLETTEAGRL
jgi:hypothetical protein